MGLSECRVEGLLVVSGLDRAMDDLAARGVAFERYDQPGIATDERGVFDAGRFRAAWITRQPRRPGAC